VTIFEQRDPSRVVQQHSTTAGWLMLGITAVLAIGLAALPAPYVIDHPGPTYDTLGAVEGTQGEYELISISGRPTFETTGEIRLTTVTRSGNPENLPGWFDVIAGWFDPARTVIPVNVAYPPGVTLEENREAARVEMENSQQESIAAALSNVGIDYESYLVIVSALEDGPSEGVLLEGDVVVSAGGQKPSTVTQLRELIRLSGVNRPFAMTVNRDGELVELEVVPRLSQGAEPVPMIGILVGGRYSFPLDIEIALENVGGPSAGVVFALGVVEKLTEEDLTGGRVIAGTGTISAAGDVGSIGGVRHKMNGAKKDGASVFIAPAGNCQDIVGHEPDGLTVVPVATLQQAVDALRALQAGQPVAQCPR